MPPRRPHAPCSPTRPELIGTGRPRAVLRPALTAVALVALLVPLVLGGAAQATGSGLPDLGVGATLGGHEVSLGDATLPTPTAVAVVAGAHGSLALSGDGTVFSWGVNFFGALGDGTDKVFSAVPVAVDDTGVLDGKTVVQVAAGPYHSVALTEDHVLASWGSGDRGQLGHGAFASSFVPVEVDMTGVLEGKRIAQLALNPVGSHFSAVLADDGRVYTWGMGTSGELGNGRYEDSSVPVAVLTDGELAGERVVQVAVSSQQIMVLTESGRLLRWGLGIGASPTEMDDLGALEGRTIVSISGGGSNTWAAIDAEGLVYTWGWGDLLGDGQGQDSRVPVAVDTSGVLRDERVVEVDVGMTAVTARTESGRMVTWGLDRYGQLGAGDVASPALSPVEVQLDEHLTRSPVLGVAVGNQHTLAVLADGTVLGWGGGSLGALGTGGTHSSSLPVVAAPLPAPAPAIFFGSRDYPATDVSYDDATSTVTGLTPAHPGGEVEVFVARWDAADLGAPVGRFTFGVAPEILAAPAGTTVPVGTSVPLTVSASGDAPPDVRWEVSVDGRPWAPADGEVTTETEPTSVDGGAIVPGTTASALALTAVHGTVRVRAVVENALGQTSSAEVEVHGVLPPRAHLEVTPRTVLVDSL